MAFGIDVGGTFTDVIALGADGTVRVFKVLNEHDSPASAAVSGTLAMADGDLRGVETIVHGTTVATNAIIERKGAVTALITTQGFRDLLEFQRQDRGDIWDLFYRAPEPLVPRDLRFEVRERVSADGSILTPLQIDGRDSLAGASRDVTKSGVESVAICFLNSYVNGEHEYMAGAFLGKRVPSVHTSLSSVVSPQFREYERMSTTVLNAYVAPVLSRYFTLLERSLRRKAFHGEIFVMQSNGGIAPLRSVPSIAASTCVSGPAGGLLAATAFAAECGVKEFISVDMGGTSTDVALVRDGRPAVSTNSMVAGFPNLMPTLQIETVGAGGGSIVTVDEGGMMAVGPESAGATPGPACYGKGGTLPTVTDAWCAIGVLRPSDFFGGRLSLRTDLAHASFGEVSQRLSASADEAAWATICLATAKIGQTVHLVSVQRGHDPRGFALIAFGGAGPLHAAMVAEELQIERVIIPVNPGAFSAYGLLGADFLRDFVRTRIQVLSAVSEISIHKTFDELAAEARNAVASMNLSEQPEISFSADVRYVGQASEVSIPAGTTAAPLSVSEIRAAFDVRHRALFGFEEPEDPAEVVHLRAVARVPRTIRPHVVDEHGADGGQPHHGRAYLGEWLSCDFIHRSTIPVERRLDGPLIIEERTATTMVPRGWSVVRATSGSLELTLLVG